MKVFVVSFAFAFALASHAGARVDAIYSVPMVAPELTAAASFPTRSDQNIYGSPEKLGLLRFLLPEELTGSSTEFELHRKADGKWDGTGTDGSKISGTCLRESGRWFVCKVAFDGLVIDVAARDLVLEKRFGRGFEFDQRSRVARVFEGQPLGIVRVRIGR